MLKVCSKRAAGFDVDGFDQFLQLRFRAGEIVHLRGEEGLAGFKLIHLRNRFDIHVAQAMDLLAEFLDLVGNGIPIDIARLITRPGSSVFQRRGERCVFRRQIELKFFQRPRHQCFQPDFQFANLSCN